MAFLFPISHLHCKLQMPLLKFFMPTIPKIVKVSPLIPSSKRASRNLPISYIVNE